LLPTSEHPKGKALRSNAQKTVCEGLAGSLFSSNLPVPTNTFAINFQPSALRSLAADQRAPQGQSITQQCAENSLRGVGGFAV